MIYLNKIKKSNYTYQKYISKGKILKTNYDDYRISKELKNLNCKNFITYVKSSRGTLSEYFPIGSIYHYLPKNITEIYIIFLQVLFSLTLAFEKMHFTHGNLHLGNILIRNSDEQMIEYNIGDCNVKLNIHGIKVKINDFDNGMFCRDFTFLWNELYCFVLEYESSISKKIFNIICGNPITRFIKEFQEIKNIDELQKFILRVKEIAKI